MSELPHDIIKQAKPGDTVFVSLRGPHTDQELREAEQAMSEEYPGVKFVCTWDDDSFAARIERRHG